MEWLCTGANIWLRNEVSEYGLNHSDSVYIDIDIRIVFCTGLFISPPGISELDCATTKTDTAERSISIDRESLQVFLY